MGADPFQLKTLGAERDEDKIVIGSEISFEFVLLKRAGEVNYTPLFESEYRDHIVKFYNDDTSTLLWQGYLQPENMYKSMFESNLHIYLSATDALKDLSDYEFLDVGSIVTGYLTGLEILKLCLTNLDQASQFQYDFVIKLGTKHTMEGVNDCALKDISHDCRRFSRVEDGKTEVDDCLTVIEKVLKPYSCILQQWGGKYYIKNIHEGDTFNYTYNWALALQGNRTAVNDSVNIDIYKFTRDADVSLLSPVKEIGIKLLNQNPGDELVADINDFSGAGPWDFSGFPGGDVIDEDPNLHIILDDGNEVNDRDITLTADFSLNKVTDNDYIKLRFKFKATNIQHSNIDSPKLTITITKPGGDSSTWLEYIIKSWRIYESPNDEVFRVTEDGDYNITITFEQSTAASAPYTEDAYLTDFSLTKIVAIEDTTYTDITFDTFYRAISNAGKKVKDTIDMYFGDSPGTGDVAGLIYAAAQTYEWDREGVNDNKSLLYLWALNYLTNRKAYSKYLILSVKDSSDNITPLNFIEYDGDNYDIVSYEKSYRSSWIILHLKERLTGDVTLDFQEIPMTSIDGEKTTTTTLVNEGAGSSLWVDIIGKPSWITGVTTIGQNLADLANPSAISFIRINANNTVSALSDVNFKTALALQNVTNESKATMFTSPTFTGTVTLPSSTLVPDGGSIGQAAGPLLTFDDTLNYLEITGCNVGINTTSPVVSLDVNGSIYSRSGIILSDNFGGYSGGNTKLTTNTGGAASLLFDTALTTRMTILPSGYIGIAEGSPTVSLQVAGTGIKSETLQSVTAFGTGFFGDGYKVSESGGETTAEFDNLIVRKLLKAYTFEIDEIDVVGGSLVISPASGTAYSVEPDIGEFIAWANTNWNTFVSSGLNLISVINNDAAGDIAHITQHYHAIAGETITITGTIVLNSGILPVIMITEDGGASSYNHALANGANNINHTVTDSGVLEVFLYANGFANCNFSFTGIKIVSDIERITFDTKNNTNPIQFKVDDYIAAQQWVNYDHTVIESYRGQVLTVRQSTTLGSAYIQINTISGAMWAGMKLAQLGNSSDAARQNLLYLTSSDSNNPYIEGHSGVSAGVFSATTRKFRLGNLIGITDPVLGALTGHGIYTQHGYFTGISAFGSSIGLDPESVDTNNVSIVGCNIYESSRNDDTGSLYINSIGYQGGSTHYRNTYIGDGENGYLLQAVGESHFASIQQAFGFYPHIFANDYAPAEILNVVYILSGAGASKTLTLPVAADVVSQFGAGKSATVPFVIVINQSDTYNLNVTTVGNADTFWYSGMNTKTYVLPPNCSIIMVFADTEWYITES
jgi:hypothetical protein